MKYNFVGVYHITVKKWPYKRGGISSRGQLLAFYYIGASKIWPEKRLV
jgi:hypothetical protein